MNEKLKYKVKQISFVFIKLAIVFGAFYFIYNRLTNNKQLDLNTLIQTIKKHDLIQVNYILILLALTSINWIFEILKWKTLVSSIKGISFNEAMQQSLGAHTAALFTPNKIGEYGAKAIYYSRFQRKKILLLTFLGNCYQLVMTIFFGCIGLVFLVMNFDIPIHNDRIFQILLGLVIVGYMLYIGEKNNRFTIKGFSFSKLKQYYQKLPFKIHFNSLLYSFFKYLIFSHQFYFLVAIFQLPIDYSTCMMLITSMYLISSLIPMLFFLDVVVKGSVAVWLFSLVGASEIIVLSIVSIMWFLNFVIPCLVGSYFVINFDRYNQVTLEE